MTQKITILSMTGSFRRDANGHVYDRCPEVTITMRFEALDPVRVPPYDVGQVMEFLAAEVVSLNDSFKEPT